MGDMPVDEFRRAAHEVVAWMADYLDRVGDLPVLPLVAPGEIRASLPSLDTSQPADAAELLAEFRDRILPGITHWNHPGFLGYFAVTGSGPGILGEMISAALNVNAMVWQTSPAGTELEEHALAELRDLVGLPDTFDGVINDTASHSSLYALAAAREVACPGSTERGLHDLPPLRVYASTEAHSSIDKAAMTLGLGRSGVVRVEADELFRVRPDALRAAIRRDRQDGMLPIAIVATLGTTSTTSVDPVSEVAEVAATEGVWLHVDAAYAGPAAAVPELRDHFRGWERADSIVLNPHKWLFTPVDCSALYTRRPEALRAAFSLTPEYLRTEQDGEARNLMDYGVALGRRFRALKLWFVLRYFGPEGIRERIREHCRLARRFADRVEASPDWALVAPVPFSTVVFRYAPPNVEGPGSDRMNESILREVNRSGEVFLTHSRIGGRTVLRVSVGNLRTEERHLDRVWELLEEAAVTLAAVEGS